MAHQALVTRVLQGEGKASRAERRAAVGQASRQYETALDALAEAMTGRKRSEDASQDPQ
jgi:hypothetical protein